MEPAFTMASSSDSSEFSSDGEANLVYIVDDDPLFTESLRNVLSDAGHTVCCFTNPHEFLDQLEVERVGCVLMDYRLPELSGAELIREIRQRDNSIPLIVITGYGTIPLTVECMNLGAQSVLEKPINPPELLQQVQRYLDASARNRERQLFKLAVKRRMDRLTFREKQVLNYLLEGRRTRTIATDMHLSVKTVEVYRSNIIKKLEVESIVELIQLLLF